MPTSCQMSLAGILNQLHKIVLSHDMLKCGFHNNILCHKLLILTFYRVHVFFIEVIFKMSKGARYLSRVTYELFKIITNIVPCFLVLHLKKKKFHTEEVKCS